MDRTLRLAVVALVCTVAAPAAASADPLVPLGPNARVSLAGPDGTTNFQARQPAVAHSPASDRFLVVWQEEDTNDALEIFGRFLDGSGTPLAAPFQISLTEGGGDATEEPDRPAVAHHPGTNRFFVVYSASRVTGGLRRVVLRSVSPEGALGPQVDMTSGLPDFDRGTRPSIACAPNADRCVVVYEHTVDVPPVGGFLDDPRAASRALVASSESPLGTHTFLATTTGSNRAATVPKIAATGQPDGLAFVASWRHEEVGADEEAYTRAVGLDGTPSGPQVPRTTSGNVTDTAIAHGGPGGPDELLLTYTESTGPDSIVVGQRLDPSAGGNPAIGAAFPIGTGGSDETPTAVFSRILDRWLVSYTGRKAGFPGLAPSKFELFARTLDRSGTPLGDEALIGDIGAPGDDVTGADNGAALAAPPDSPHVLSVVAGDDTNTPGIVAGEREVYARRIGRPGFVAPSPEPPAAVIPSGPAPAPALPPALPAPSPPQPTPPSVFDDPDATPADLALACAGRAVTLIDVLPASRGRVVVTGAARGSLVGRQLTIRRDRAVAGRATVRSDGTFRATVAGPRTSRERQTVRYTAASGKAVSRALKLSRRMTISSLRRSGSRITFAGRVARPLGRPVGPIIIERQTSCTRFTRVATVRPRPDGRFSVRFTRPSGGGAAVYRARTRVPQNTRSRKLFPTFSLPRPVR